jgi:hypothetical protein
LVFCFVIVVVVVVVIVIVVGVIVVVVVVVVIVVVVVVVVVVADLVDEQIQFQVAKALFGNGIFMADGDDWRIQRTVASPLFKRHRYAAVHRI